MCKRIGESFYLVENEILLVERERERANYLQLSFISCNVLN